MAKRYMALFVPLLVLLTSCGTAAPTENQSTVSDVSEQTTEMEVTTDTSSKELTPEEVADLAIPVQRTTEAYPEGSSDVFDGWYTVEGYVDIVDKTESFCEENCRIFEKAQFVITSTPIPPVIAAFLEKSQGNSYTTDRGFSLGCLEDTVIEYSNQNDEEGMVEDYYDPLLTAALLESSADAPVTARLLRKPLESGMGAPDCYSHIRTLELID